MATSGSRRVTTWAAAMLAAGLTVVTTTPSEAIGVGTELRLTFGSSSLRTNDGGASLTVRQVTYNGGTADVVSGRSGDSALRLLAYRSVDPRFAVLSVTDQQGTNDLAPDQRTFSFGIDFALDEQHEGHAADNGNNLIQRGLFGAAAQYKLDVDGGRPGCRVKGSDGAVMVRSTRAVQPGAWYRLSCARDGAVLTLRVLRLSDRTSWTYQARGATGRVVGPASTALSVGGKLDAPDRIAVTSSDQFNGLVDNVFLDIVG